MNASRKALSQEHQIPILNVPNNMQLGKYTSFCQLNDKGNMRKVNKYSYLAVEDWGKKGLTMIAKPPVQYCAIANRPPE